MIYPIIPILLQPLLPICRCNVPRSSNNIELSFSVFYFSHLHSPFYCDPLHFVCAALHSALSCERPQCCDPRYSNISNLSLFIPSLSPSYNYKLSSSQTVSPSFSHIFNCYLFFPWLLSPFLPCVQVYFHFPHILVSTCVSHFLDILALCLHYSFNL